MSDPAKLRAADSEPAPDERAVEARLEARAAHRAGRGRRHSGQRRLPR